jgi:hypothetical protein
LPPVIFVAQLNRERVLTDEFRVYLRVSFDRNGFYKKRLNVMAGMAGIVESYSSDYDLYLMGTGEIIRTEEGPFIDIQDFRPGKIASVGRPDFKLGTYCLDRRQVETMLHYIAEPILVAGDVVGEPGIIKVFDSPEEFEAWSRRTYYWIHFREISRIIRQARGKAEQDEALDEWAEVIRGKSFGGNFTFFEGKRYQGKSIANEGGTVADFRKVEFAKHAKSLKGSGVCMLAQKPGFGGTRLYLTGDSVIEVSNLAQWGFKNGVMSAVVL